MIQPTHSLCSAAGDSPGGDPRRMPRNTKWPVYLIGSERAPITAQQQQQQSDSSSCSSGTSSSLDTSSMSGSSSGSSGPYAFGYLQSTTLAQEVNLVVSHSNGFCNAYFSNAYFVTVINCYGCNFCYFCTLA
jgi:hypothetical protein